MPLKVNIYFKGKDRGIKWCVRASTKPSVFSDYIVDVTINPKILAGIIDYLTAATYIDMNFAIINFNDKSKQISPLLHNFNDYQITRIDYCVNICLDDFSPRCSSEQIMNLIKRSDIPPRYQERMEYDDTAHRAKSKPESFYLKSKAVNINYYSKYLQLLNKSQKNVDKGFDPIDPEILEASRNIYRFEVQCKYHKIYSLSQKAEKTENHTFNKYKSLLNPVTCIKIVSDYYKKTIGKGDWYSLPEAVRLVKSKNFNCQKEQRLINALKYVSQCRSLAKAKKAYPKDQLRAFKQTLNELSKLNINPVTIPREWNIKYIPNLLKSYFDKLIETSSDYSMRNTEMHFFTTRGYMNYYEIFGHSPI